MFHRRTQASRLWVALATLVLVSSGGALALDPSLDLSQYAHTAWRIRDGFLRSPINAIAQTPDGYLWLGTEFGLFRFDGVRAVPWQPKEGQLPSSYITCLLVALDGTLWIGTLKGLASWKDGKLTQYPELAGQIIFASTQDRNGTVWVGTAIGGRLCAVETGKVQCQGQEHFGSHVLAVYEDHRGNLWVSAHTGLWRWKPGPPDHYELPSGTLEANGIIEDDSGAILLATNDGLKRLTDGKLQPLQLPGFAAVPRPNRFFRSSDGSLWISTHHGLLRLHEGRTDLFRIGDGLSGEGVIRVYEDRERSIWVGTTGGLDRFRAYAFPRISALQGLSSSDTWAVLAAPDGSIWIGASDGLNRWQNGHVTFHGRQEGSLRDQRSPATRRADPVLDGVPNRLALDDHHRLWVATPKGVFYLERDRFVRVPGLPSGIVWSMSTVPDGHGTAWLGFMHLGLFRWTGPDTVQQFPWTQFKKDIGATAALPDPSSGGGLWLGFFDRGVSYLENGRVVRSYSEADGLGAGRVNDLRPGGHGTIWAATEGGLSRIRDGHVLTLTASNGMPCDAVHWSIEDDDHSAWLYMPCGLVLIARSELDAWVSDPKRKIQATLFDASDGIATSGAIGTIGPRVTKAPDGKIWFTSVDGITVIDPRHLPRNDLPPPVHIEQVTADGRIYDASGSGRLRLPARIRDLAVDYTALSLVVPEKLHFRVKLEGQDKDWRELVNVRHAQYTNLPPGGYRFLVKASNNSGVWNEEGAFLDFAIAPAYWQTSWFRALALVFLVGLFWATYRIRVGVLERHQRLLEQHQAEITALNERLMKAQEEERSRIAGELHDGVVQQMTTVNTLLGVATMQVPPDSRAKATIDKVQDIVMGMGSDVRHLSHELHPGLLKEAGLPEALCSYCKEFSTTRGIPVTCEADSGVQELSPGTALALYRIAQEALGNAAKHSRAKQVRVRLIRADEVVSLIVSDDGVGFVLGRPGDSGGVGLVNMRERVRYLNGTFELDTQPGRGTTIRAEVPFRPA